MLRYLPSYYVDEHILRYFPRPDACRLAMVSVDQTLTINFGNEERETGYAEWQWCWRNCGCSLAADGHTNPAFMNTPSMRSPEEVNYEAKLSKLIGRLREKK